MTLVSRTAVSGIFGSHFYDRLSDNAVSLVRCHTSGVLPGLLNDLLETISTPPIERPV
jgi:hypothetical protein